MQRYIRCKEVQTKTAPPIVACIDKKLDVLAFRTAVDDLLPECKRLVVMMGLSRTIEMVEILNKCRPILVSCDIQADTWSVYTCKCAPWGNVEFDQEKLRLKLFGFFCFLFSVDNSNKETIFVQVLPVGKWILISSEDSLTTVEDYFQL